MLRECGDVIGRPAVVRVAGTVSGIRRAVAAVVLGSLIPLAGCGQGQSTTAATVQTGVTQVAPPASLSGSPTLAGPVQISQVAVSGADAVIFLQNVGAGGSGSMAAVDISNWKIEVGSTVVTLPEGTKLTPGTTLGVHAGPAAGVASPGASPSAGVAGPSTQQNVFLGGQGAGLRQALQSGAQVRLVNGRGEAVSQGVVP